MPMERAHDKAVVTERSSLEEALHGFATLAGSSEFLIRRPGRGFRASGDDRRFEIPRLVFAGPRGGGDQLRVGIFAAMHGDEKEGTGALLRFVEKLERQPLLATGFDIFLYPVCNPTGFADHTRHSRAGKDLNREFWRNSREPEVRILETELNENRFHGLISLHADDTSEGFYGFINGATLAEDLLRPALEAAGRYLPANGNAWIDGFSARRGVIRGGYAGMLTAPPGSRPAPFEVVLESPQKAPLDLQERGLAAALETIITEYPKLLAFAPNL